MKLDDAVKASRAALDVNFDEVGMWCVLVCISGASVDAYTVHVTRNFTKSDGFRGNSAWIQCGFCKASMQLTVKLQYYLHWAYLPVLQNDISLSADLSLPS